MPTRTKPAWYAHCWMFCLSQFGMPTTGLGVKLGMPTAQLTEPVLPDAFEENMPNHQ